MAFTIFDIPEQGRRHLGREGEGGADIDEDRQGREVERGPEHRRRKPEAVGGHQLEPEDVAACVLRESVREVQDEGQFLSAAKDSRNY